MFRAEDGDTVTVHYTLAFKSGVIFDTTRHKNPFSFILGDGDFMPGFEKALLGMSIGQTKTVTLKKEEAFGAKFPDLIQSIPRKDIPDHVNCVVGQNIEITLENNQKLVARVTEVDEQSITLDANPPQVGEEIVVTIELMNLA